MASGLFLVSEAIQRLANSRWLRHWGSGYGADDRPDRGFGGGAEPRDQAHSLTGDPGSEYRTDLLTNAAVLAALVLAQFGWLGIDPLFALAVAAYTLKAAWDIINDAISELLDQFLAQRDQIIGIASAHPRVLGVHDLRTRSDRGFDASGAR